MNFLSRAGSAPAWPSHCQSQYSSSEAARKGIRECLSELLLQLQFQVRLPEPLEGPGRARHPDSHTSIHKNEDEEVVGGRKREVGDGRRVVGGEASKPADSGAFTLVCGRRCSELRPRDPAGGCSPAQPGPSGHPGSSAGPESQRLVCWRVLSFSGLFSSNAKGGVRQSLASSCSKPLRLEDKSLSQGFSEQ